MRANLARLGALAVVGVLALTACSVLPARTDDDSDDSPLQQLQLSGAAARYLVIAEPANAKLDLAFDGVEDDDDDDLAACQADFRSEAATERAFDRDLLATALPSAVKATARALVKINESRAMLTDQAAQSATLAQVSDFEQRIGVVNDAVEDQVRLIRTQLGLPPPDTD